MQSTHEAFVAQSFQGSDDRLTVVLREAIGHYPANAEIKILDIGCGTGHLVAKLAEHFCNAQVWGVDISPDCIDAAKREHRHHSNCHFICQSVLDMEPSGFDLIVSESTLQNIDCPDDDLLAKLNHLLSVDGVLVNSMPYLCWYNRMLWAVRRWQRKVRTPFLDACFLNLGRLVYRDRMSKTQLAERLMYMYLLPRRWHDPGFDRRVRETCGLKLVSRREMIWSSIAQPKHSLCSYRRG